MKKIEGMNFSVRFFRRGVARNMAQKEMPLPKEIAMNDIPEQNAVSSADEKSASQSAAPRIDFSPEKLAKEKMLRDAAQTGDCYLIRMLVMEGVDLEARDNQGRTALNIATQYNRHGAIKTLLAAREMRRMATLGELPDSAFFRKFKGARTA